jgi:hypothetical protein
VIRAADGPVYDRPRSPYATVASTGPGATHCRRLGWWPAKHTLTKRNALAVSRRKAGEDIFLGFARAFENLLPCSVFKG